MHVQGADVLQPGLPDNLSHAFEFFVSPKKSSGKCKFHFVLIYFATVKAAVESLKKRKSAGAENVPPELVQAGGEAVITAVMGICNKIWQTEWPTL